MKKKNFLLTILVIVLVVILGWLMFGYYQKSVENFKNPIVTMEVENYGTIKMELYPDVAPNTVSNFIKLINEGYYNGVTYHRVIPDVLIQGGSSDGTSSSSTDFAINGEFAANGYTKNTLKHLEGTVSMARADYSTLDSSLTEEGYNSAGTQFFICLANSSGYDGLYAGFGKVIEGLDVVKAISNTERTESESGTKSETPVEKPVIKSMTVETFGVKYDEPERHKPFDYNSYIMQRYYSNYNTNSVIKPE